MMPALVRIFGRLLRWSALGLAVLGVGAWVYFLRVGPDPEVWHRAVLDAEFTAAQAAQVTSIADYQALEDRLFDQLRREVCAKVVPGNLAPFNRFAVGSYSDPGVWPFNWNRTYEIVAPQPVGGILLLHGLTDSPYSLRSIGADLGAHGWHVVGLRLPGHGTAPSGLLGVEVEDLEAAVRMAMLDLRARLGPGKPIYIVGYSNGAALAVSYSLSVLEGQPLPRPAGLVLISPAIAVSPFAVVGRLRTGISELPGFSRAAWQVIEPELDPYKYQSFPFHAAGETHRLTSQLARRLERLAERGPIVEFPPVLAFLSTVDATIRAEAVVDVLLSRLAGPANELVLFDVNRFATVQSLMVSDPGPLTQRLLAMPRRPFALAVVTNANPRTRWVKEMRADPGSGQQTERLLGLEWPATVFSLSHVALPFPPDDLLYGYSAPEDAHRVQLGRVEVRGENGVLRVPGWMLTRQRSNPFHSYVLQRIEGFVAPARATH
jgi:alpha-beta hydrolase superfamily lysophospholipase